MKMNLVDNLQKYINVPNILGKYINKDIYFLHMMEMCKKYLACFDKKKNNVLAPVISK